MDFFIDGFPIHAHRDPREAIRKVEDGKRGLPVHAEWVQEEQVPGEGHHKHLGAVRVLQVYRTVLYVIARPEEELSLTVELESLRWLVYFIGSLQILSRSLGQLCLGRVNNLMEVVNLAEGTAWLHSHYLLHHWCF
jgi:hypothetical protein